jgi:hypothetical protein
VGARSLLENDVEYDLSLFGKVYDDINNTSITFEDAYLAWKDIEKPKPLTFEAWFESSYPKNWAEESPIYRNFSYSDLEAAWNAAIASMKGD